MRLVIEGHGKKIKQIAKELKVRCRRNNLKLSLEDKTQEAINPPELTAKQVAELIVKCETIEDLKKYESDTRQVVKAAYSKKLKELE